MYNDLFTIGGLTIHTYGLMIAIGVLSAFLISMYRAKKRGLDSDHLFNMGFAGMICGAIGAKLLYIITDLPAIIENPSILLNVTEGFVVYGGIIGGVAGFVLFNRLKKREPIIPYMDLTIPAIALAQAFGRIGCLMAGCCYGTEMSKLSINLPIGITFPEHSFAPAGVELFPSQIVSSLGDFIIFFVLMFLARPSKKEKAKDGTIISMYMILYSVGRFAIEFFRNDYRGSVGFLSTSQFISVFILIAGIIMMILSQKGVFERRKNND